MDGCQYLARCAGHAAISEQGHALATVLQCGQCGREFVQLGHAIGTRPLTAHDSNEVAVEVLALVQFPGFECGNQRIL